MKPFLILFLVFILIYNPVIAEKNKGLFSGEIFQTDIDLFTGNVSDTPAYLNGTGTAVNAQPQDILEWIEIGKTQLKAGNWKPSEETFLKVINLDPKNTNGWEGYLLAIRGGGNYQALLEASERAAKENPGFASAWKYNGIALSSLNRSEEALNAFDSALEIDPDNDSALYNKGIALDDLGRYAESVISYGQVLTINPNYTKAWNNKGVALIYTGMYDDAIAAFDKALEIDPTFQKASENKNLAIREKGMRSLGVVDIIDDASVFVPLSTENESGEEIPQPIAHSAITIQTEEISISENPIQAATPPMVQVTVQPVPLTPVSSDTQESGETSGLKVSQSSITSGGSACYRANPARTGEYPGPAAMKGKLKWKCKMDISDNGPVALDGMIYVGSTDTNMYALNDKSGKLVWKSATGGKIWSSPAIVNGILYVGSFGNYLYAFDSGSGDLIWEFDAGTWVRSSPIVIDGIVYFGTDDKNFNALDAETGEVIWKTKLDGIYNINSPSFSNGVIFVINNSKYVYALDSRTGIIKWRVKDELIEGTAAVADNVVYVVTFEKIIALDAESGSTVWESRTGRAFDTAPAVSDGTVFVGSNDDNMYAFDADSGDLVWKFKTTGDIDVDPIVADGIVYFGANKKLNRNSDNYLYAVNAKTGALIWKNKAEKYYFYSPVIENGILYVYGDGDLYAFE